MYSKYNLCTYYQVYPHAQAHMLFSNQFRFLVINTTVVNVHNSQKEMHLEVELAVNKITFNSIKDQNKRTLFCQHRSSFKFNMY